MDITNLGEKKMAGKTNKNDVVAIMRNISQDPELTKAVLKFFADSIIRANELSPNSWAVFERNGGIVLIIRNVYTISLKIDYLGNPSGSLFITVATSALAGVKDELERLGVTIGGGFKKTKGSNQINLSLQDNELFSQSLALARPALFQFLLNLIKPGMKIFKKHFHNPAITKFLSGELRMTIPDPEYYIINSNGMDAGSSIYKNTDGRMLPTYEVISRQLTRHGYHFSPEQIACFYTALQTKGFVILSGISGTGKTKLAQEFARLLPQPDTGGQNHLFLSVRPDWRDSKSLLGYYNPLTRAYQTTPFVDFLIKARDSHERGDDLAWFVILDEMNLARVEYYFADLLSVLESGRDEQGYTREALRFEGGDLEEGGDLLPRELRLPPNLYIIGTVNVDETTQSFSPKVLDRAFSMEFVEVDLGSYNPMPVSGSEADAGPDEAARRQLLDEFTRNGEFAQIDKTAIGEFDGLEDYRDELAKLNAALQQSNHHFGYRVFDEIMMFMINASENHMFECLDGGISTAAAMQAAFDRVVLMKVLPKFHGSRGKLEQPLRAILAWCAAAAPDEHAAQGVMDDPFAPFEKAAWRYPATAARVRRMIQSLHTTGFASSI